MAELVSRETGKIEEVPDDQAQALYQSGRYGFVKGSTVSVQDDQGQVKDIPAAQVGQAFKAGHTFVGPEEMAKRQQEEKYGGVGGGLIAGAAGVARGATFGLFDPVALDVAHELGGGEAKESLREKLQGYKEANPISSIGGELVGAVAPSLLTGGAGEAAVVGREGLALAKEGSTVAKLAGTAEEAATLAKEGSTIGKAARGVASASPAKLASFGSEAAEKAVAAVIGDASENTLARVLQKGVAKGAGGFIEGGLYGVGSEISEDALGDHDITGEKLAAAFGHGGFYGSLIGGGLGAGGEALSSGAKWALTKAAPAAKRVAEDFAIKAIGGESKAMAGTKLPGGARGVAQELLSKDLVRSGETVETIAPRIRSAAQESAEKLDDVIGQAAGHVKGPKAADLISSIGKETEATFGRTKELSGAAFSANDSVAAMITRAADADGFIAIKDLRALRKDIDGLINWRDVTASSRNEALAISRRNMEGALEKSVDEAGEHIGGDALQVYKAEKLTYRRLTTAADQAVKAAAALQKHSGLGFTEKAEAALGIVHGIASGNPLAAGAGMGIALASKLARERGSSTVAATLNKIADLGAIRRSVEAIDGRMTRGLDGFLENKAPEHGPRIFKSGEAREEAFTAAVKRTKAASANPEQSADHVSKVMAGAVAAAPKISRVAMTVAGRSAVFLASKVPPNQEAKTITPQFDTQRSPSAFEQDKFLRYVRAIDDPMSILDDMQEGRLTKEGVETLREVYPRLFEDLQKKAIERCADLKHPLGYNQKIQLGLVLGIPTDATLEPAFMRRMQAVHQENGGKQGGPGGGAPHAASKRPIQGFGQTMALGTQRSDK